MSIVKVDLSTSFIVVMKKNRIYIMPGDHVKHHKKCCLEYIIVRMGLLLQASINTARQVHPWVDLLWK